MAAVERETRRNLLAKRCLRGCSSPAEVWRERGWRRGVVGDRCLTTPTGPGFWPLISSVVCAGCYRNGPLHVKPWTFCIRSTAISWTWPLHVKSSKRNIPEICTWKVFNKLPRLKNVHFHNILMRDQNKKMSWIYKFRMLICVLTWLTVVNAQSLIYID